MLKHYRNIGYFYLFLFLLALAGFYRSYFGRAPDFENVLKGVHFHAFMAIIWWVWLVTQPLLIRQKNHKLHRILGRASVLIVLLFIISTVILAKHEYARDIAARSREAALATQGLTYIGLWFFLMFYGIAITAIVKYKNVSLHIAFMTATALVMLEAGLGRLLGFILGNFTQALLGMVITVWLIIIGFIVYEKKKMGKPVLKSPYLLILALIIGYDAILTFGLKTPAWQWVADKIVTYLYASPI